MITHADALLQLEAVQFRVSEAGRQRAFRERAKNGHAGVVGEVTRCVRFGEPPDEKLEQLRATAELQGAMVVTYAPYKHPTFVLLPDRAPILEAGRVLAFGQQLFILPD
ncbi:hypothetical protein AS149_37365 [Burkholderia cenocepacia]|nr:hypothetical protein AS149_37365 [Burkholderia cenocepacia]